MSDEEKPDPEREFIDIGEGHSIKFVGHFPDRELNPQYKDKPDVPRAVVWIVHRRPDNGEECHSAATLDTPETQHLLSPGQPRWRVVSWEPLTLEPSILCLICRDHGFIREGRWVSA